MPLPKGQHLIKDFVDITVEDINTKTSNDLILAYKDKQKIISYSQLLDLIDTKVNLDMHCVDGWSVINNEFEGISLNKIISILGVSNFEYIGLESNVGFKSFIYKDDCADSFLCLRLNKKPLSIPRGFPMRFIAPKLYAYKWVKYLKKITFTDEKPYGYWENRGYSARARVDLQERFEKD
jgi:DMSO/TMAO reductase YedYZ molybdopterin-dependent catalytic subunit